MAEERLYTVFEVINNREREIYVAVTKAPIFEAINNLRSATPPAIRHWQPEDITAIKSIEFHLTASEARAFVERHVKAKLPNGWRFLT